MFRSESERTNRHAKVGAPRSQEATTDPGPLVFFRSSPLSPCIPLMTMIYSAPVVPMERAGAIRDPRGQQSDPLQLPWNVQIRNASQLPPPNSFRCKRFPTRFFRTRRQHHRYKLFRMSGLCKYPLSKSCGFNSLCNLRGEGVPRSGLECPACGRRAATFGKWERTEGRLVPTGSRPDRDLRGLRSGFPTQGSGRKKRVPTESGRKERVSSPAAGLRSRSIGTQSTRGRGASGEGEKAGPSARGRAPGVRDDRGWGSPFATPLRVR